jgi:hypothetical protein
MDTREAFRRVSLVSACLLLTLAFAIEAPAGAEGEKDLVLPGCGICYPGGYDPNTVGEVRGPVSDLDVPDDGPVRFTLNGDEERWVVLASPAWFWKSADVHLAPGETVTVRGSKSLGADGKLYIVAQSIGFQGRQPALLLRDARGVPLWRGGHGRSGTWGGGRGRR